MLYGLRLSVELLIPFLAHSASSIAARERVGTPAELRTRRVGRRVRPSVRGNQRTGGDRYSGV